ncbi:response regulator [Phormidium yuhuli AB48]|uniref:Response regulator n=1 Tax=Phormidium yuhuli AB48 TaxID=2940671 RepID=A0ABY5AT62_9CYAN|nr:response regulator [Phormidium yuhuli]USR92210.1 response regulator [Phormidium yuhuli AB48]
MSSPKTVLIVDDQLRWRTIFKILLDRMGLPITIFDSDSLESASQLLEKETFDLAILDLRLVDEQNQNLDGLVLLRTMKDKTPETRIILSTAYPSKLKEQRQEADSFVLKVPDNGKFDINKFQETVKSLLYQENGLMSVSNS